jgi:hypothetical protein
MGRASIIILLSCHREDIGYKVFTPHRASISIIKIANNWMLAS